MAIADHDGVVEIGGHPFTVRTGDEYPDDAVFREAEQPVARPYPDPHAAAAADDRAAPSAQGGD